MSITKTQRRGLPAGRFTVLAGGAAATARQEDVYVKPVAPAIDMADLYAGLAAQHESQAAAERAAHLCQLEERLEDLEHENRGLRIELDELRADTDRRVSEAVAETEHRILGEQRFDQARRHGLTSILND